MSFNSKIVRAVAEIFKSRSRPNLSEGTWQKSCESSYNWANYKQKNTTYFKEAFLQVPLLKQGYQST